MSEPIPSAALLPRGLGPCLIRVALNIDSGNVGVIRVLIHCPILRTSVGRESRLRMIDAEDAPLLVSRRTERSTFGKRMLRRSPRGLQLLRAN